MPRKMDLTGNVFGILTVLREVEDSRPGAHWFCQCQCGGHKVVSTGDLKSGKVKSCGCYKYNRPYAVKDITGNRYGRLIAIKQAGTNDNGSTWLCKCDCGNETIVSANDLKKGQVRACGCLGGKFRKGGASYNYKHGQSRTRLYTVWENMKYRCYNKNAPNYKNYGGRGISVCDEWQEFEPFYRWALQSGYDPDAPRGECTIDRIDVNGNYEPSNCRWVDMKVQRKNQRSA